MKAKTEEVKSKETKKGNDGKHINSTKLMRKKRREKEAVPSNANTSYG